MRALGPGLLEYLANGLQKDPQAATGAKTGRRAQVVSLYGLEFGWEAGI